MSQFDNLPTVHILYENPAWLPPLEQALREEGFPYELHHIHKGSVDPSQEPPAGIWWNRMSPSSHTRGHGESVSLTREVLAWLESWGRWVLNGSHALELEVSKLRQELALRRYGIRSPRTVLANDRDELVELARSFDGPFITKHNQGGKGLGIQLFSSAEQLAEHLDSDDFDPGPNGQIILQQYIQSAEPYITRVEIAFGRFLFAMRSNTEEGFQLCPSDACQLPAAAPSLCAIDGAEQDTATPKFSASPLAAADPLVRQLISLTVGVGLDQAGIEFIEDAEGNRYVYDINGTTNYSSAVEREVGLDGMLETVRLLKSQVVPRVWSGPLQPVAAAS
ncbi:MAG: alpha-L-glutamate ligase [Rickettsiales bacterium]|nr:alpha-L-glutamate ligase [Rickettsiales bacterium]|tara:strand:+ start:1600 stop:2607 length:1008 start_codon:yes stop_codon:yes gene_type:complete